MLRRKLLSESKDREVFAVCSKRNKCASKTKPKQSCFTKGLHPFVSHLGYGRREARELVDMFAPGQNSVTVTLVQVLEKEKTKPDAIHALYDLLNCDSARWFPASGVQNETVQLELEIA